MVIVFYHSKYGDDAFVCENRKAAYKQSVNIIIQNWNDIENDELKAEFKTLIKQKKYEAVLEKWRDYNDTAIDGPYINLYDCKMIYETQRLPRIPD